MRAIQRFGKQLQQLRTRRDRWPVAHVSDAAGIGTARPFVEHASAIGEGAEGVGDGVARRDHEYETVVAGRGGSLCDARGCRESRPHRGERCLSHGIKTSPAALCAFSSPFAGRNNSL